MNRFQTGPGGRERVVVVAHRQLGIPMYHLQTFGGAALSDEHGATIRLRSRKHLALLVFLVANGRRVHTRRELSSLFWSTPAARARHSLSQAVYDLRRRMGGILLDSPGEEVRLRCERIQYDVSEMERAVKGGQLGRAVEICQGPFAPNLQAAGTNDFERWLEGERARLSRLSQITLRRFVQECDAHARWGEMSVAAVKLIEMDPLDEEAHRSLMRGLWLHGDRTSALRHYDEIQEFLSRELSVGVSEETLALAEQIRRGAADGVARPTRREAHAPLVGRTSEFHELKQAVRRLRDSVGGSVVVRGETGIGKSHLIRELSRWLSLEPVRLIESRCYAAEADVSYGPVVEALQPIVTELARSTPAECARFTQLGHLFSGLSPQGQPSTEHSLDASAWRRRLYEEVTDLVRLATRAAPIVWVVEDIQWIDGTSRSLLHYLARRLADCPLLLLMTERIDRGTTAPRELRRHDLLGGEPETIVLSPLGDADIDQLVTAVCPTLNGHPAVDLARRLAGGNPLFALEVVRAACTSTEWIEEAGNWDPLTNARLSDVLAIRFRDLSPDALRILQAVSVLERHATPRNVAMLAGLSLPAAAELAAQLYGRGLLLDKEPNLGFSNEVVRDYLYRQMTGLQRAALHLTAAELLERESNVGAATLARHFSLGDNRRKTYSYAMAAASEASTSGGHDEAVAQASLAVSVAGERSAKLRALRVLAQSEMLSAQLKLAQEHYTQILALDDDMPLESRIRTKLDVVATMAELSEWSNGQMLLGEVAEEIDALPDKASRFEARAESLYWTLKIAMRRHDLATAGHIADEAQRLRDAAVREGALTPISDAVSLCCLAAYRGFFSSAEAALQLIAKAQLQVGKVPSYLAERIHLFHGMMQIRLARWDEGEKSLLEAVRLARRRQDAVQLSGLWNNLACCALEQGDWERFEKNISMATTTQRTLPARLDVMLPLTINRANAFFYRGSIKDAAETYAEALNMAREAGSREFLPELMACTGLTALYVGDLPIVAEMWSGVTKYEPASLAGAQEAFKIEWFRCYIGRRADPMGAAERLIAAADRERSLDIPSYLKLLWIRRILFPEAVKDDEAALRSRLKASRLAWFPPFFRRWMVVAESHASRLGRLRGT